MTIDTALDEQRFQAALDLVAKNYERAWALLSTNKWRGHRIRRVVGDWWVYADTNQLVQDQPDRPCGHCGLPNTPEGHDGCLGVIPGAINACCGHGQASEAYTQYSTRDATRD